MGATIEDVMEIQGVEVIRLIDEGYLTDKDVVRVLRDTTTVNFITDSTWWRLPSEERPCSICGYSMGYSMCPSLKDTCADCCHAFAGGCCG
jgi:hypothetical protein